MANNYVDIKETVWRRFHFSDTTDMKEVARQIKEESFDTIDIESLGFSEEETLYDTAETLGPEDNGGEPTVEVYKKEQMIWDNVNSL